MCIVSKIISNPIIYGAFGFTIGVIFTAIINHFFAGIRDKEIREIINFSSACEQFSNTIHDVLRDIYPIPFKWPEGMNETIRYFENISPELQSAVNKFAFHLSEPDKTNFLCAWDIFRLGPDGRKIDKQDYWQYIPSKGEGSHRDQSGKMIHDKHDNTKTYKEDFKHNVDNLLKFANYEKDFNKYSIHNFKKFIKEMINS